MAQIAQIQQLGVGSAAGDYPSSYRNNQRRVDDEPALAVALTAELLARCPELCSHDDGTERWELVGVNPRIRRCVYQAGQSFSMHQDGVHHRGPDERSLLTVMLYLNAAPDFSGGDTVFYASDALGRAGAESSRYAPETGTLIVFEHALWHAGAAVHAGEKFVLRSDLIYRRRGSVDATASTAHLGYIWRLLPGSDGSIWSSGRDATIRRWDSSGRLLQVLRGHQQSVLGLATVGESLISVSRDRSWRRWDAQGRCVQVGTPDAQAALLDVVGLADGCFVISDALGAVHRLDAAGQVAVVEGAHTGFVWRLAATQVAVLSIGEDGVLRSASLVTSAEFARIDFGVALRTLSLCQQGNVWRLAIGDSHGSVHWLCSLDGKRWQHMHRQQVSNAAIRTVLIEPNGAMFVGGEDFLIRHITTAGKTAVVRTHQNFVTDMLRDAHGGLISAAYDGQLCWG